MKRVLLDTNIYGNMLIDSDIDKIKEGVGTSYLVIYGLRVIRNELRATPRKIKVKGSNLRIDLLGLYDELVKGHSLETHSDTEVLARHYYRLYQELGGHHGLNEVLADFLIVAEASVHSLDIVVSEDEATMKHPLALKAYTLVNSIKNLRNPDFLSYAEFKTALLRRSA